MDDIITRFFIPLVNGFWNRYKYKFRNLIEEEAKAEAVVICWIKFDNYDPAKGNGLSYFSQVISRLFFHDNVKELTYRNRFINESAYDAEDE